MEIKEDIKLRMFCVEQALEYYKIKGKAYSLRDVRETANELFEWILNTEQ